MPNLQVGSNIVNVMLGNNRGELNRNLTCKETWVNWSMFYPPYPYSRPPFEPRALYDEHGGSRTIVL